MGRRLTLKRVTTIVARPSYYQQDDLQDIRNLFRQAMGADKPYSRKRQFIPPAFPQIQEVFSPPPKNDWQKIAEIEDQVEEGIEEQVEEPEIVEEAEEKDVEEEEAEEEDVEDEDVEEEEEEEEEEAEAEAEAEEGNVEEEKEDEAEAEEQEIQQQEIQEEEIKHQEIQEVHEQKVHEEDGPRYPRRNRILPTEYWRNQKPIYEQDPLTGALVLVGVTKAFDELKTKKAKTTDSSVLNPSKKQIKEYEIVTIEQLKNFKWQQSKYSEDVFFFTRGPEDNEGYIKLGPNAVKRAQRNQNSLKFRIEQGKVKVTIGEHSPDEFILMEKSSFRLPCRKLYSLTNIGKNVAFISFEAKDVK